MGYGRHRFDQITARDLALPIPLTFNELDLYLIPATTDTPSTRLPLPSAS